MGVGSKPDEAAVGHIAGVLAVAESEGVDLSHAGQSDRGSVHKRTDLDPEPAGETRACKTRAISVMWPPKHLTCRPASGFVTVRTAVRLAEGINLTTCGGQ